MLKILEAQTEDQIDSARILFREYESWVDLDLSFQGFEDEVANLPGMYAPPDGKLLLGFFDGELAGCVALRKLDERICEMKRLFVRDGLRGRQIGQMLIERIIADARKIGYKSMRLDTLPAKMGKAVKLYESHGFCEIPPYNDNPHRALFMFMELSL